MEEVTLEAWIQQILEEGGIESVLAVLRVLPGRARESYRNIYCKLSLEQKKKEFDL